MSNLIVSSPSLQLTIKERKNQHDNLFFMFFFYRFLIAHKYTKKIQNREKIQKIFSIGNNLTLNLLIADRHKQKPSKKYAASKY